MNIIFGREQAALIGENYTVLELDTIKIRASDVALQAWCVLENIPLTDYLFHAQKI